MFLFARAASAQNLLPPDPQPTCTLTPQQFATWFQSQKVTPNGLVNPADSLNFKGGSLCAFYQWSSQMFLWLNSPAYGTGGRVFDSPVFYDVEIVGKNRILIPSTVGRIRNLAVRSAQVGSAGQRIKVDANGQVSNVETGQAGGNGTLLSQQQSLVYYSTHVNDVFAYMLTGTKTTTLPPISPALTTFPTTASQLQQITNFAQQQLNKQVFDPNALAMELKISWVDASTVPNPQNYITMWAFVPTFDFSTPPVNGVWPEGSPRKTLLAMVGMHVVGSVAGHPELIWATFEHVSNAPNGPYSYTNTKGQIITVPQNTQGNWLFCANGATGALNQETLTTVSAKSGPPPTPAGISPVPSTATTAVPSNTIRSFPWGGAQGNAGVQNNTEIIALNNAIISMLGSSDVRTNYVHVGSVWTQGAIPPGGTSQPNPPVNPPLPPTVVPPAAQSIGSVLLSNATMETYHQVIDDPTPPDYSPEFGFNCFNCHNTGNKGSAGNISSLSHIWSSLQPLK